jgi:hypothetical protein
LLRLRLIRDKLLGMERHDDLCNDAASFDELCARCIETYLEWAEQQEHTNLLGVNEIK